jgi:hypothetical protein
MIASVASYITKLSLKEKKAPLVTVQLKSPTFVERKKA